jgi:hypothetical protein
MAWSSMHGDRGALVKKAILAASTLSFLALGCSHRTGDESTTVRVVGHWQFQPGASLQGMPDGLTWLDVDGSGAATLYARSPVGGVLSCAAGSTGVLNDTVLHLQTGRNSIRYYTYSVAGDSFTLGDGLGATTALQRRGTVDPADVCIVTSPVVTPLPAEVRPHYWSSLGSDGTKLFYTDEGKAFVPFDPATGTTGTPIPSTGSYAYLSAVQGGDFWGICACGGSTDLERQTATGSMTASFDTYDPSINHPMSIDAATHDGSRLWVAGTDRSAPGGVILRLDVAANPVTLEATYPLPLSVQGMAFRDGKLYLLAWLQEAVLVEWDLASGKATRTYSLPQDRGDYHGLAVAAGKLYALVYSDEAGYVLDLGI